LAPHWWQLPDEVIDSLNIKPGDHVSDIGAGGGYFTFILADAVGPNGKVYAVDVDEEITVELEDTVSESGHENIVVVLGEFEGPLLPDGTIDLVFLCNTYHHIEDRADYFSNSSFNIGAVKESYSNIPEGKLISPIIFR